MEVEILGPCIAHEFVELDVVGKLAEVIFVIMGGSDTSQILRIDYFDKLGVKSVIEVGDLIQELYNTIG